MCVYLSQLSTILNILQKMSNIWIRHEPGKVCVSPPSPINIFLCVQFDSLLYEVLKSSSAFLTTESGYKKNCSWQAGINCCHASTTWSQASTLGAEKPLREPEGARQSQRKPECVRVSQRESQGDSERTRVSQREQIAVVH